LLDSLLTLPPRLTNAQRPMCCVQADSNTRNLICVAWSARSQNWMLPSTWWLR